MIHVYAHAIQRYQERVEPVDKDTAKRRILSAARAIERAASFGCQVVRLANGARLILDGENVVTVYAKDQLPRQCRFEGGRVAAA